MSSLPPSLPPISGDQPKKEIDKDIAQKKANQSDIEKVSSAAISSLSKTSEDASLKERKLTVEENNCIQSALRLLVDFSTESKKNIDSQINSMSGLISQPEWATFTKELTNLKDKITSEKYHDSIIHLITSLFSKVDSESKEDLLISFYKALSSKEDWQIFGKLVKQHHMADRKLLIEIVSKLIVQGFPEGFDILKELDDAERMKIARSLLESNERESLDILAYNLGKFAKEEQAMEIANGILSQKYSYQWCRPLCESIKKSAITKQDLLSLIAKTIARISPVAFTRFIQDFNLNEATKLEIAKNFPPQDLASTLHRFQFSPQIQFEFVKKIFNHSWMLWSDLFENFPKYSLELDKRIEFVDLIKKETPLSTISNFDKFKIQPVSKRIEFALFLIDQDPISMCRHIKKFEIEPERKRFEFARLLIQREPEIVCRCLENFEITDINTRYELAILLSKGKGKENLYELIKNFNLNEKQRIEVLRSLITNFSLDAEKLKQFEISDQKSLFELAQLAIALGIISDINELWDFEITDPQHIYELLHSVINNPTHAVDVHNAIVDPKQSNIPDSLFADLFAKALAYNQVLAKYLTDKNLSLLMLNPEELPNMKLAKGTWVAEFREKINKLGSGKTAKGESKEGMTDQQKIVTRWLGYLLFCSHIFLISDEQLQSFQPILNQIFLLRNPELRYQLTYSLFTIIHSGPPLTDIVKGIFSSKSQPSPSLTTTSKKLSASRTSSPSPLVQLVIPLLAPLILLEPKVDFSRLLKVLDHSIFSNNVRLMEVIKSIQAIMQNPIWTMQQKQKLFRAIFPMSGVTEKDHSDAKLKAFHLAQQAKRYQTLKETAQKALGLEEATQKAQAALEEAQKAQELVEQQKKEADALPVLLYTNLEAVHNIIRNGGHLELTNLLKTAPEATLKSAAKISKELQDIINSIFLDKLGFIIKTKGETFNYDVLRPERNRSALFIYAAGLNTLSPAEREPTKAFLKSLVESVVSNTYKTFRYDSNNKHLQEVFKGNEELRKNWQDGESIPFEQLNIQKYLHEKIIKDRHLNPSDYGFITEYLKTQNAAAQQKIQKSLESKLSTLKAGTKEFKQLLLEDALIRVVSTTEAVARRSLLEAISTHAKEAGEVKLHQDIKDLNAMAAKMAKELHAGDLVVQDTDNFQDLLLIGTDVDSSCQRITFSSDTSKALLAYIGDGKIRAIVVKNKEGRVLARRLLRILLDNNRQPVLVQEMLYSVNGINREIELAVDAMVIRRAQALGLPLLGTKEEAAKVSFADEEEGNRYSAGLSSLGSPAPFEYVDSARLKIQRGAYTIPGIFLEIIWEPKKDKGTETAKGDQTDIQNKLKKKQDEKDDFLPSFDEE